MGFYIGMFGMFLMLVSAMLLMSTSVRRQFNPLEHFVVVCLLSLGFCLMVGSFIKSDAFQQGLYANKKVQQVEQSVDDTEGRTAFD